MKFLVVTHVLHKEKANTYFAYAPYVREMNIWFKHVDEVEVVAPMVNGKLNDLDEAYKAKKLTFTQISKIEFTSLKNGLKSLWVLPGILYTLFKACRRADHIHLRCPGNIGLLGCLVQIFYPNKVKTAKYAGNWDPESKQPLSYRLQKSILRNTSLTKNMATLVYGNWPKQTKNILPFFTATYHKSEVEITPDRDYNMPLKFLFVGSLTKNKRPLLAIKVIKQLLDKGIDASLDLYGGGSQHEELNSYVAKNNLEKAINFKGKQSKESVKNAYKNTHFLFLFSKSEGWPKVVAEAMFFGTIPISTNVSCVSSMLDNGNRGILVPAKEHEIVDAIQENLKPITLSKMSKEAQQWSQEYTIDKFEVEILKLLQDT